MKKDSVYGKIVELYRELGTVNKVVEQMGKAASKIKVQRVLITEGLWSSKTSKAVGDLFAQGKTTRQIAEELHLSEKNVQSYLPYTKGLYNEDETDYAKNSKEYRERNKHAAAVQIRHVESMPVKEEQKMFWPPAKVYRLKLELLYELSDEEEEKLHKYGKVKEKLSREIIVPEKMTLHALHYAIQRAFGWQNSHLHHFSLDSFVETENLERITGDQFSNWVELCGRYFRFPTDTNDAEEMDDLYWDEDYEETMSHKVWLRKKYTGPYTYNGIGEHLLAAQMKAKYFVDSNPMVRVFPSFQEYLENKGKEKKDEIKAVGSLTVREANRILESGIVELLERLRIDEVLSADKPASSQIEVAELDGEDIRKYAALITRYRELMNKKRARDMIQKSKAKRLSKAEQKILLMPNLDEEIQDTWFALKELFNKTDEKMLPIINKLYYAYDYGDGWEIAITCEEVYTLKTNWTIEEEAGNEWISGPVTDKQILEDYLVFDKAGESVTGPLRDTIVKACVKNTAKCLVVDGLNLMDDVGGIHMYCDFLEETATGSEEERTSNLTWAEGVGWTGKMPKAENLL